MVTSENAVRVPPNEFRRATMFREFREALTAVVEEPAGKQCL